MTVIPKVLITLGLWLGMQGRSSTKLVDGPSSWKNANRPVWPIEKILAFEWPRKVQMAFEFFPE